MRKLTRRQFLSAATALPLVGVQSSRASAAEFRLKFATGQDPTHPVNHRAQEAIERIRTATAGRVEINLFPANQLGSDTDLISQLRFGAVDYLNIAGVVLATLVSRAGFVNTGFAFPDYEAVWKAMDGAFGAYVRSEIEAVGLLQPGKAWNNGFRQLTTTAREVRKPDDLKGLKMRVPAAPILTSLFQALGAGPTPINFNELYSALQTRIVEGQRPELARDVEPGVVPSPLVAPRAGSNIGSVIGALERCPGATIDEIAALTGWLPHTTRAALTGLRKRGHVTASDRSDRTRGAVYRIARAEGDAFAAEGAVAMAQSAGDRDLVAEANPPLQTVRKAAAKTRGAA